MGSFEVHVPAARGGFCHSGIRPSGDRKRSRRPVGATLCGQSYGFIRNCESRRG